MIQDCKRPSQERSLPIPHDWSLRWLVLGRAALSLSDKCFVWEPAAGPAPAETTAAWATEGQCWLCSRRKETKQRSVWPRRCSQEERDYFSHMCVPQTITHTHIHGLKPYSIKISPAVLHFLESSLNISEGWMLPHPDAKGHQTPRGTNAFVSDKVFASRNWRDNWERCKSTMIKRKRRKKNPTFRSSLPDVGCDFLASHRY